MGVASVTCRGGCTCGRSAVDAHRGASISAVDRLVSVWSTRTIAVRASHSRLLYATEACSLLITVLNETSSGGHKFKLARAALL
eukprot:1178837-Prymnesium_polylepis.1